MFTTQIIAHRGFRKIAPENTLPSFKKAIDFRADSLEMDLHLSKDGQLVVIHDEEVDRTTDGTGYIKDLTVAEIKKLDAGNWFDSEFKNTRIPTFEEFLDFIIQEKFTGDLLIELKTNHIDYPGIEKLTLDTLKKYQKKQTYNHVILQSFNQTTLKNLRELDPTLDLAMLVYYPSKIERGWLADNYFNNFHPNYKRILLSPWRYWNVNNSAYRVWVVNNPIIMKQLFRKKLLGLITDDVASAVRNRDLIQGKKNNEK